MDDVERILTEWLGTVPEVTCFTQRLKVCAPTCYGKCEDAVDDLQHKLKMVLGGSTTYNDVTGCFREADEAECESQSG